MDDDFIEAINATADTSFDTSVPTNTDTSVHTNCTGDRITCPVVLNLLANPNFAERRSGITTTDFYRPGERSESGAPFEVVPTTCPEYLGPPTGRAGNDDEKRGAWQLQEEYLAGRLGKNEEENGRNWNTATWLGRHLRIMSMPAGALPPLNIYIGDKISQSTEGTGAPTGPDDEAPDEKAENEGFEFESIYIGETEGGTGSKRQPALYRQSARSVQVMQEDGTTHRLEIKTDDHDLLRLIDALEEIDDSAKIDVNDLIREGPPFLPQADFPSEDQRAESGKIIRMLMVGMRTLWHPVIQAITDHATMTSLGKTQGVGDKVAAAVGRSRVIEGLRLAESIRKGLGRKEFVVRRTLEPSYTVATCLDEIIRGVLARLGGQTLDNRSATWPPYRDWQGPCCYIDGMRFLPSKPLPSNDNLRSDDADRKAA